MPPLPLDVVDPFTTCCNQAYSFWNRLYLPPLLRIGVGVFTFIVITAIVVNDTISSRVPLPSSSSHHLDNFQPTPTIADPSTAEIEPPSQPRLCPHQSEVGIWRKTFQPCPLCLWKANFIAPRKGASSAGRRRALLIACSHLKYKSSKEEQDWRYLPNSWKDPYRSKNLLLSCGWELAEIVILAEKREDGEPESDATKLPTRANITMQMKYFVKDANENDFLFFQFSGHGGQIPANNRYEKDGQDEFIFPCDGYFETGAADFNDKCGVANILDNEIREEIIDPLPTGCRLFGLVDCCASGTMLDLPFEDEHIYNGSYSSSADRTRGRPRSGLLPRMMRPTAIRSGGSNQEVGQPSKDSVAPLVVVDHRVINGSVISISACADNETGYETEEGGLLIQAFCSTLKASASQTSVLSCKQLKRELATEFKQYHQHAKQNAPPGEPIEIPVPQFSYSHQLDWETKFKL